MKKSLCRGLIAFTSLAALASCQDYEGGFSNDLIKKAEYAKQFEKTFGTPDPNQDWSMATRVKANVNLPQISGTSQMNILTCDPSNPDARLLAQATLQNGQVSIDFDAIKGADKVFVTIAQNNEYKAYSEFSIVNGALNINNSLNSGTRATLEDPIPVCEPYANGYDATAGVVTSECVEGATVPFPIVWKDGTIEEYKTQYSSAFDYTLYLSHNFATKGTKTIGNFYQISNLAKTPAPGQSLNLMYNLYEVYTKADGTQVEGPFKEGGNSVKKYLGEKDAHEVDLQKDALLVTLGGETTLTYVGKGTDHKNDIGYFYYPKAKESEYYRSDGTLDFEKVPKFVCFKDMSNTGDLITGKNPYNFTQTIAWNTQQFQYSVGKSGGTDKWEYWDSGVHYEGDWKDVTYTGTTFKLAYFGDDATETGTYDFPADYVVGFFGVKTGGDNYVTTNHCHVYCTVASVEKNYFNDYPRGATFKFKGNTYMGLEDNTDYDINDYLFVLTGFDDSDVPDVTPDPEITYPIKWHKNYDGTHHENDDDLHSKQDLTDGSSYIQPSDPAREGYTFMGWAEEPDGTPSMTISATVESAGKCYYAIWEEIPTPVTIKWHKNYDGTHHTSDDDLHATNNVNSGDTYSKPSSNPQPQPGKVFVGWAEDPDANTVLTDEQLTDLSATEDKCYYAIYRDLEYVSWIFACEDLGGSFDYDFNDVVWEVRYSSDTKTLEARLLAAGGTLPFTLVYNSTPIVTKADAFGNTSTVFIQPNPTRWYEVGTVESWSASNSADREKFQVVVDQTSYEGDSSASSSIISTSSENGNKTPQVIVLPYQWCWPTEGTNICSAYTEFTEWVSDASWSSWSSHKQEGKTVNR